MELRDVARSCQDRGSERQTRICGERNPAPSQARPPRWRARSAWSLSVFFFFQAEDGIRDLTVTGVQTCALPIYRAILGARNARLALEHGFTALRDLETEGAMYADVDIKRAITNGEIPRSEEHTSELQSQSNLVCRLLLEKKKKTHTRISPLHTTT